MKLSLALITMLTIWIPVCGQQAPAARHPMSQLGFVDLFSYPTSITK
jgi:hypothetical protein